MIVRQPVHAGSWYDSDEGKLRRQVAKWLEDSTALPGEHARAIIGPHAGYRFCGHVLAHAFKQVQPEKVRRIFMIGPSHHFFSRKCLLSTADIFASPLGNFRVDAEVYAHLRSSGLFDTMALDLDENEHSLEMHLPFVAHLFKSNEVTIVPIVVGSLSPASEEAYGQLLAPYVEDDANLFALSSDFCHWGSRFGYTPYDQSEGDIHQYIEYLDRTGMEAITTGEPEVFNKYLKETNNTICGRHAISMYLQAIKKIKDQMSIEFRKYDQSSQAKSMRDSSVSYAAGVITVAA
eukprot:CAMPEP_0177752790 /NCGR_PEP_ID=MMETSP0491_2-20121128/1104_1 /TAXON_ID=63592 /ORGANISM="Tetraselmis chuii, Strain PLY429" /LENGTH=290 /DNA_ID=CAMNT_0019268011 /DNA_START=196 /DNA_END=1068 /DNA_ORIENTATION=-